MARFSCLDCGARSHRATGCHRCGSTVRQIQRCPIHGGRCIGACRMCRRLARSRSY
ncbi:hypothetical protein [Planobispora takensis]|uniref:Uncharacterized protein n=1 Tax=Planobispora takensis TaxID=1367882 RepID=A0A8J3SXU6_9ACTN|nr:hypothetical protein [Planobispora takensis]GII01731.1 hypothetical protein Pta02_37390 [Planobispora takensis]